MITENIVTFLGSYEDLEKVTERLYSPGVEDDDCFDFDKIIPVPRQLFCICFNIEIKCKKLTEYELVTYIHYVY